MCLMNPPYSGNNAGDNLYVDFLNKCIEICKITCSINPDPVLLGHMTGGWANKNKISLLRKYIDDYHPNIEEQDPTIFDAAIKSNVSICLFNTENIPDKINITFKTGYKIAVDKQENIVNIQSKYLLQFWECLQEYFKKNTDNVFNHLFTSPGFGDTIKKYQEKRIKDFNKINKNKFYVFMSKPNASFGTAIYKSINKDLTGVEYNEETKNQ